MQHCYINEDDKGKKFIEAVPLVAAEFTEFGDVIECVDSVKSFEINQGFTTRYHNLADVDVTDNDGKAIINIFRSTPLALPIQIGMMERHPKGSQAFIPMGTNPYLVVVAPKGDLDLTKIRVFLATAEQGVNYHKGTWHHFCLALNEQSDFLVVDRGGKGDNCDEIALIDEQKITIRF
ncbi:ureidoglycolate lyase [Pseudoalteromonas sp. NBT06-2]|uniref:ureidoglycolate lyase n=1 Tax=Pseudoalteromonas sp. NBT06-2 TaxID=2025950 RepID=UPI000BA592CD|nr:ureidoglycolate lyase [Pseudoalteromonas sp. NBT06-2]PAJ75036.1 ureidoglycolate lyase [Pseudoalteromonas sp. NBT06-2]